MFDGEEGIPETSLVHGSPGLSGPPGLPHQQPPPVVLEDEEFFSLGQHLHALRRRKWLILAVVFTTVVLAALQVFTTTSLYRSTVTIQVDVEGAKVLPYAEVEGSAVQGSWGQEYLWTQAKKLRTRKLARRVVQRLDLANNEAFNSPIKTGVLNQIQGATISLLKLPFRGGNAKQAPSHSSVEQRPPNSSVEKRLVGRILGFLEVRSLRNTRLIEVSYSSPDRHLAALVANTLAEEFIEENLEEKFQSTIRATEFLEKQLKDLQIKLEAAEENLLKYAQSKNIVNLTERETIARSRLANLATQVTEAESELITHTARLRAAKAAGGGSSSEILKTDRMRELESRISERESTLAGLSKRYGPAWPTIRDLNLEIEDLQRQLRLAQAQAMSSARQMYDFAMERHASLVAAFDQQRQLVDRLNEDSIQYNILRREAESNQILYEALLQRLKEAGVAAGLRSSNMRIADEAPVPGAPASPRKRKALTQALMLGLFLGIGGALLIDRLDNTVKTTEDVTKRLGLPALGVVPSFNNSSDGATARSHFLAPKTPRHKAPIVAYQAGGNIQTRALEAYRSMRTSLLLSHSGSPPQAILVTSALAGEGKSTTGVNTAIALSQTGAPTLLIDLDLRKPSLNEALNISASQGMTTFLTGKSDLSSLIHRSAFPNLYLIPAGPPAPNPPELIGSQHMAIGLQLTRKHFTYIVIDSPPLLEITDALVISPRVDGVILVVQGAKTPRKAVAKAAERIGMVGAKLLGVLINDVDVDIEGASLGHPYYYGYPSKRYENPTSTETKSDA